MKADDYLYGCRSAIQKGIRRCDLDLVKTAFDTLWKNKPQRSWLKWRTTVLFEEDKWHMLGELAKFYDKKKPTEKDWRKLLYQVCVASGSKDTEALYYTAHDTEAVEGEHKELEEMRFWMGMGDPIGAAEELLQELEDGKDYFGKPYSQYQIKAANILRARMSQGGMKDDRMACLAGMVLIKSRLGMEEEVAQKDVQFGLKWWKKKNGNRQPKKIPLPWYVFDMHTAAGKFATSVFMKHKAKKYPGLTKEKFEWIWFDLESARIPKDRLLTKKLDHDSGIPLATKENMWWPEQIKRDLAFGDYTPWDVVKLWKNSMQKEIRDIVKWCLDKRDSK